jgi:hypothetical protein
MAGARRALDLNQMHDGGGATIYEFDAPLVVLMKINNGRVRAPIVMAKGEHHGDHGYLVAVCQ